MTEEEGTYSLSFSPPEIEEIKAAANGDAQTFIKNAALEKARAVAGGADGEKKVSLVDLLVSLDLRVRNLEASIGGMNQMPHGAMGMGMGSMGMGAMGGMGPMGGGMGMGGMGPMGGGMGMGGWGGGPGAPWGNGPGGNPFGQPGWPDPFDPFLNQDPPTS
jgi:hypothetical protein